MQKLIDKLQYVADGLVKQGFGKDGESVLTIAQVIDELKQQSCQADVSGRSEQLTQLFTGNDVDGAYFLGVFNTSGIDGLDKELKRVKELGFLPHVFLKMIKGGNCH